MGDADRNPLLHRLPSRAMSAGTFIPEPVMSFERDIPRAELQMDASFEFTEGPRSNTSSISEIMKDSKYGGDEY